MIWQILFAKNLGKINSKVSDNQALFYFCFGKKGLSVSLLLQPLHITYSNSKLMKTMREVLAIIACLWVFTACNNTQNEVAPTNQVQQTEDIIVKNGALHFKNEAAFLKTVARLNDEGSDLATWEKSLNFDNSLRKAQEEAPEQNEVLDIPDQVFAAILNKDGVYYIGNEIHKVTPKVEYTIKDGDAKKLQAIAQGNVQNLKNVEAFKVKFGTTTQKPNARFQGKSILRKAPYPNTATHLSAHLEAWSRGYALYSSVGVRIKGRKYKRGGAFGRRKWRDDDMWFAEIGGQGYRFVYLLQAVVEQGLSLALNQDAILKPFPKPFIICQVQVYGT